MSNRNKIFIYGMSISLLLFAIYFIIFNSPVIKNPIIEYQTHSVDHDELEECALMSFKVTITITNPSSKMLRLENIEIKYFFDEEKILINKKIKATNQLVPAHQKEAYEDEFSITNIQLIDKAATGENYEKALKCAERVPNKGGSDNKWQNLIEYWWAQPNKNLFPLTISGNAHFRLDDQSITIPFNWVVKNKKVQNK